MDDERSEDRFPASGLAEDLIPLLRARLRERGESGDAADSEQPEAPATGTAAASAEAQPRHEEQASSPLLDFADRLEDANAAAAPTPAPRRVQFVTFYLGGEAYGLPIESVQEILRVGDIVRVPQAPPYVRGVTNTRGRLLPVVELGLLLGSGPAAVDKDSRIVVAGVRGRRIGLLVDRATDVLAVEETAIEAAPADVIGDGVDYLAGVGKVGERMVFLLDVDRVLSPAR